MMLGIRMKQTKQEFLTELDSVMRPKEEEFDRLKEEEDVDAMYDMFLQCVKEVAHPHFEKPLALVCQCPEQGSNKLVEGAGGKHV